MKRGKSGVLGIFSHLDSVVEVVKQLRREGYRELKINSPAPFHEIEEVLEPRVSSVRVYTLVGAILGCVSGFALTIGTSLAWPLVTGEEFGTLPLYP